MPPRIHTPEQDQQIADLRRAGLSYPALARQFGGTTATIRNTLRRAGVVSTSGRPKWRLVTPEEVEQMGVMWQAGMSQREIGGSFGFHQSLVSDLLRGAGVKPPAVKANRASGENHGNWKGGRISLNGYTAIRVLPGSPYRGMMVNKSGYVLEHRLVMARALGRPLERHETVHHINGDKSDNRIENLQLRNGRHGKGVAMRCADCGSHNITTAPLG